MAESHTCDNCGSVIVKNRSEEIWYVYNVRRTHMLMVLPTYGEFCSLECLSCWVHDEMARRSHG